MEVIAVNADPGFHRSCCGPAPKTKIRRHRCDMTPYAKPCQQSSMCLGFDDMDQSDPECNSDSSREFDDFSNFVFSSTGENTMCHNEPEQTTITRHTMESMVATPPCHFESMTTTEEMLQRTVDHEIKMSSFTPIENQQQKLQEYDKLATCSQRSNGSPVACDSSPTSTTVDMEKPKKLEDYKVQDLKNECKKRQLPVSGAKPQLLERLRPYEESILFTTNAFSNLKGTNARTPNKSPNENSYESISTPQEAVNSFGKPTQSVNTLSIAQPSFATNNVLQFNPSQQFVQLVDSTGIIVGVATVQTPSAACCCSASSQQVETQSTSQPDRCVPSVTLRPPPPAVSLPFSLQSSSPQATFSFAQHGSGGQFTLAPQESSQTMDNHDQRQMESRPTHHNVPSHSVMERRTSVACCQPTAKPATTNLAVCSRPRCFTSPAQKSRQPVQSSAFPTTTPVVPITQASPAVGDQPGPSPNLPSHTNSNQNSSGVNQSCSGRVQCEPESTPTVPLSAQTFSIHEDMLRVQQKKIEELQTELTKSQMQLRQQQQAILNAKKAQVKAESGHVDPAQAAYLNKLDIKNLNKYHIQLFLQHKLQLQKLQLQVQDFKTLQTAESRIQEELHIEQAVHDIVRLIKQDSRTALLIVQLLRRYQIERNSSMQSTSSVSSPNNHEHAASPAPVRPIKADCNVQKSGTQQVFVVQDNDADCSSDQAQSRTGNCSCSSNRQTVTLLPPERAMSENSSTESTKYKEHTEVAKKSPNKAPVKKRNGIKSIWSRMNSLKALNGKESNQNTPMEENSTTAPGHQNSSAVDMEEIFRTVLEDASKALNESENTYGEQCQEIATVVPEQCSVKQDQTPHALQEKTNSSPIVQENPMNENTFGEDLNNCSNQPQFIEFAAPMQTFISENGYTFQNGDFSDENKDTTAYELKDQNQNVMYLAQNHVGDQLMDTTPPPAAQNSNQSSYDHHKDFDELMDSIQHDDDGVMYCSSTINGLSNCTYPGDMNDQWMDTENQQYPKTSSGQIQISSDCSYINVFCGMNNGSEMLPQQIQWNDDFNATSGQLTADQDMFGALSEDIGCDGTFAEPIYMQQGVASSNEGYSS